MKKINYIIIAFFIFTAAIYAGEKRVLVEIFTNSHCPLCPPSHTTIDNYLAAGNSEKIEFIYYHMAFPYSSDQLYQDNTADAAAKNNFYGPFSSTPKAFFNGTLVSNSYNNWGTNLDQLATVESNFDIALSGEYTSENLTIYANVTQTGVVSSIEKTINYVIVEDLTYQGNNGISSHKNVMRKIVNPAGELFTSAQNETVNFSETITLNPSWATENIKIIVFVQDKSTKETFQATSLSFSEFSLTDVNEDNKLINDFSLSQNYPNPFNPTTTIKYTVPSNVKRETLALSSADVSNVKLIVYDIVGREVATLVNQNQNPGNYSVSFNATDISSGIYYYTLTSGNLYETKKMILLK